MSGKRSTITQNMRLHCIQKTPTIIDKLRFIPEVNAKSAVAALSKISLVCEKNDFLE